MHIQAPFYHFQSWMRTQASAPILAMSDILFKKKDHVTSGWDGVCFFGIPHQSKEHVCTYIQGLNNTLQHLNKNKNTWTLISILYIYIYIDTNYPLGKRLHMENTAIFP